MGLDQVGYPVIPQPVFDWSVSGGGTIDSTGLFTANGTPGGPFTITVQSGGFSDLSDVTTYAAPPQLFSITVSPPTASVTAFASAVFTAVGYDQYGALVAPPATFAWSVSGGGTINGTGAFAADATPGGPFTITASGGGSITGTASVTVTALTPPSSSSSKSKCGATGAETLLLLGLVALRRRFRIR